MTGSTYKLAPCSWIRKRRVGSLELGGDIGSRERMAAYVTTHLGVQHASEAFAAKVTGHHARWISTDGPREITMLSRQAGMTMRGKTGVLTRCFSTRPNHDIPLR